MGNKRNKKKKRRNWRIENGKNMNKILKEQRGWKRVRTEDENLSLEDGTSKKNDNTALARIPHQGNRFVSVKNHDMTRDRNDMEQRRGKHCVCTEDENLSLEDGTSEKISDITVNPSQSVDDNTALSSLPRIKGLFKKTGTIEQYSEATTSTSVDGAGECDTSFITLDPVDLQITETNGIKGRKKQLLKPKSPLDSEAESEEDVPPVRPVAEPVIISGKRSCTLRRCAFPSCPHHAPAPAAPEGITYFPFPKSSHNSARWARIISRAQGEEFKPKLTSVVCSLHFAPWQILPDGQGGSKLDKTAAPRADPVPQDETRNIEEVLLPERDPDALDVKVEMESSDYEVRQAVDSIVDIPPPENGIRIQCVGLDDSDNATLHYLSVDKDYTVNHTRVNINKNNIATLNYVDTNCKVNHTLKCIDLNEENISTYEELVKPNITSTQTQEETIKIEITPNTQNTVENSYNFKIKRDDAVTSSRNDEHPVEQLENTAQMNSTDDLSVLTTVKSEICDDGVEIEDIVLETNDEILIKQELNDGDELYVVQMEYED